MDNMQALKEAFGPEFDVLTIDDYANGLIDGFKAKGVTAENSLMITSQCPDDNMNALDKLKSYFKADEYGFFPLGSFHGYPSKGALGVIAPFHHVPNEEDNNYAVILYGPHIGIHKGEFGKVHRRGQERESACCGAGAHFIGRLEEATSAGKAYDPAEGRTQKDWGEVISIEAALAGAVEDILAASNKYVGLAIESYKIVRDRVQELAQDYKAELHGATIIDLPAIFVNGPKGDMYVCIEKK